jgi:hypothetical protein
MKQFPFPWPPMPPPVYDGWDWSPWPLAPQPVYGTWQDGWDWLVIAHENVGQVVSVQFHPLSKKLPKPGIPLPRMWDHADWWKGRKPVDEIELT